MVEVLSEGNTPAEMQIKLGEYAAAGVKLVWYVDPERQEALAVVLREDDELREAAAALIERAPRELQAALD